MKTYRYAILEFFWLWITRKIKKNFKIKRAVNGVVTSFHFYFRLWIKEF